MNSKRKQLVAIAAGFSIFFLSAAAVIAGSQSTRAKQKSVSSRAPIYFERTSGTEGNPILYSARGIAYDVFISREEADVVLNGGLKQTEEAPRGKVIVVHAYANVLRMRFVGADVPISVCPAEAGKQFENLFSAVAYRGIYPGTDIFLTGDQRQIGFELRLSPGADVRGVVLELAGATSISLDGKGNAVVRAGRESLVIQRPVIQESEAGRRLKGAFRIEPRNRLRFVLGAVTPADSQTIPD